MAFVGAGGGQGGTREGRGGLVGEAAQATQDDDVELAVGQATDRGEKLERFGELVCVVGQFGPVLQGDGVRSGVTEFGAPVAVGSTCHDSGTQDVPGVAAGLVAGEGLIPGQPEAVEGVGDGVVALVVVDEGLGVERVVVLPEFAEGAFHELVKGGCRRP
ncbi:hypothetical protein [Streptomyces sp. AC602_WCS936]|uniref:hypothetical protein n=1 Tax=Streptomyces sp. AC602_WCS936 TaxID=2823685 RepID=UPI001C277B02|nr:hypothetical protein [Streptomyces sp. AC602_WCS936]